MRWSMPPRRDWPRCVGGQGRMARRVRTAVCGREGAGGARAGPLACRALPLPAPLSAATRRERHARESAPAAVACTTNNSSMRRTKGPPGQRVNVALILNEPE